MKEWMGADLSGLDIMVVQTDGIHISEHLVLVAAVGSIARGSSTRLGWWKGHRAQRCGPGVDRQSNRAWSRSTK
jgi:hypothetical protein